MITQMTLFCTELSADVEAFVESEKKGSKEDLTPISCTKMAECAATTFCRFVNPLTTRNPLQPKNDPIGAI